MKEPLFSQMAPLSKKDRVVTEIRGAIVSGRMKPGDAIVETRVARQLGVGQPLIREALLDLEHQGFVQRVPYRGTSVTRLGPDEIDQIQCLRVELESLAIEWARTRASAHDLADLRACALGIRQAACDKDLARFNDYDLALHRKIWQLSGNRFLQDALERAMVPMLTFFYLRSGGIGELHVRSVAEHEALVDLVASDKPARGEARRLLESLKDQCETLVEPTDE